MTKNNDNNNDGLNEELNNELNEEFNQESNDTISEEIGEELTKDVEEHTEEVIHEPEKEVVVEVKVEKTTPINAPNNPVILNIPDNKEPKIEKKSGMIKLSFNYNWQHPSGIVLLVSDIEYIEDDLAEELIESGIAIEVKEK